MTGTNIAVGIDVSDQEPTDDIELTALGAAEVARGLEQCQRAKFRSPGGHGFAAEDANALADRLRGHSVEVTGTTNRLDGADRVVDGVAIQTKYHARAGLSVDAAFDNASGRYRYTGQQLEVPADQYQEAVAIMERRIRDGRVPGVTDPAAAGTLVRAGSVTYRQARNIARAGTIASLKYDAKTQVISTAPVFAISFVISYARARWHGHCPRDAVRTAVRGSATTGATTYVTGIAAAQLLRSRGAAIGAVTMRHGVRAAAKTTVGRAAIERVAQASLGKAVYGAAATNHVAKLLRTNALTAAVATTATTAPDFYRVTLARSISWSQFAKNLFVNATAVGGGAAGFLAGGALGLPFGGPFGALVVGLGGALLGSAAGARGAKAVADQFAEDDAERMVPIVRSVAEELAEEYLLSETEVDRLADGIKHVVTRRWLRKLYRAGHGGDDAERRAEFARARLEPLCDAIAAQREVVPLPPIDVVDDTLRELVQSTSPGSPPPPLPVLDA